MKELEVDRLQRELAKLKAQNRHLTDELTKANETIKKAKDPNPVQRPSKKRVTRLAGDACMSVARIARAWLLKMGNLERRFRTLKDIWETLIADDWSLTEIFSRNRSHPPRMPRRYPSLAPASPLIQI